MRVDGAGAKTWMLGALALWALALWALGLFGLGSRIDRLPADASLLQRLPQAVPTVPERLGALPQYAEIGDRPLFTNDRRPQPFFIDQAEGEEPDTFEYVLTSVLITPALQMAIVRPLEEGGTPVRLRVGEAPEASPGWTLASIGPRQAVFNGPDGERTLELRVFDGVGGEPPTVMAATGPAAQAAGVGVRPQPGRAGAAGAAGLGRSQGAQAGTIPVTTSSSSLAVPVPTPAAPNANATPAGPADAAADDHVDAIRRRIEARRAQMREQTQQQEPAPAPVE